VNLDRFGKNKETGATCDFEGSIASTLHSKGCVDGVGVVDVCGDLVAAVWPFLEVQHTIFANFDHQDLHWRLAVARDR
jgi:hypothetical protein